MTTGDLLALPTGSAEDDFYDLVEEAGEQSIARLLAECRVGDPDAPGQVVSGLEELAAALADALLDEELGAPRGISPHSPLRDHPDFPRVLGLRVLGAQHLHDALARSTGAALLAGLLARHRLLEGERTEALELAVLAASLGSSSSSSHTGLAFGVLAAALEQCGGRRQAAGLRLLLETSGVEVEAWRDAGEWATCAPWTDGTRFSEMIAFSPRAEWRAPYPDDDPRTDWAGWQERTARMERFGLWHFFRRNRGAYLPGEQMLLNLEDLAIQEEWEYL